MLPVARPDVVYQSLSEGAVLLSTTDEVYFGLNEVAARIWEAVTVHATWDEVYAAVEAHYPDTDPAILRVDILELVDDLLAQNLLLPPPAQNPHAP